MQFRDSPEPRRDRGALRHSLLQGLIGLSGLLALLPARAAVVEEIIVTAQKRPESARNVPVSLSVVTAQTLETSGIQRLEDLRGFIPNFSLTREPIGDKLNLRGVQSGTQAGFEQSVGTFVDGLYRGRGIQSRFAFLDADSVEVLRGPQATLFGQNTMAGALKIGSALPSATPEALLSVSKNLDFRETDVQGTVSGPLGPAWQARAVILDRRRDKGHVFNTFYRHAMPQTDESAGRLTLRWLPDAATTITFKTEYGEFATFGMPGELSEAGPLADYGAEDAIDYSTRAGATDPELDFSSSGTFQGRLRESLLSAETALDSGLRLALLAGYSDYRFTRWLDADASPLSALRFDDSEQFSQRSLEMRISNAAGSRFTYMAGLYVQDQQLRADGLSYISMQALLPYQIAVCERGLAAASGGTARFATVALPGNAAGTAARVAQLIGEGAGQGASTAFACAQAATFAPAVTGAGIRGINRYVLFDQGTRAWSAFLQTGLDLTEQWSLALGLRFNSEEKQAAQGVWGAEFRAGNTAATASAPLRTLAEALGEFSTHRFTPDAPGMTRRDANVSWSGNLRWQPHADAMLYLGAGKGYKSGGYNSFYMGLPRGAGSASADTAFGDESALSVELGLKTRLFDGSGEFNVALFHSRFEDLQVSIFTGGTTFVVQNAAEAVSRGLEIDSRWALTERLTLRIAAGYLDFTFRDFRQQACVAEQFLAARQAAYAAALPGNPVAAGVQAITYTNGSCALAGVNDLHGRPSENSPRLQAAVATGYVLPLANTHSLTFNLDLNWRDAVYRQGDLDPYSRVAALLKMNFSVAFEPRDRAWTLALLVRNLTDETELLYVNDVPTFVGARVAQTAEPRSVTLRAAYRF